MELIRVKLQQPQNADGLQFIILSHDSLLEKYFDRLSGTTDWYHNKLQGSPPMGAILNQSQARIPTCDHRLYLRVAGDGRATEHHLDELGTMMKTVSRAEIIDVQQIPNIGPSIAAKLRLIGVLSPNDLLGKDPYRLYDDLCQVTGVHQDPCVIDVFIAAVRFMAGETATPWWKYTPERKRTLAARRKGMEIPAAK